MNECLEDSIGRIANVSANNVALRGYSEVYEDIVGTTLDKYTISSSMIICEIVKGRALPALEASMKTKLYNEVLSNCLRKNATVVFGYFTSLQSPTSRPEGPASQLRSPTLRPTDLVYNGEY